jgi:hypothetical protein
VKNNNENSSFSYSSNKSCINCKIKPNTPSYHFCSFTCEKQHFPTKVVEEKENNFIEENNNFIKKIIILLKKIIIFFALFVMKNLGTNISSSVQ